MPTGKTVSQIHTSSLATFDTMLRIALGVVGSNRRSGSMSHDIKVLIVEEEQFRSINVSTGRPAWAGVYVDWSGYVIYHREYVERMLTNIVGSIQFGGEDFTEQYFFREMIHEIDHSRERHIQVFQSEEETQWFYGNSLWWLEGQRELVAGIELSPVSDDDFATQLSEYLVNYPEFSSKDLEISFWHVNTSPAGKNFAYQYAARWLEVLLTKLARLDQAQILEWHCDLDSPLDMAEYLTWAMVQKYRNQNFRGNILDFLQRFFSVDQSQLHAWEREWQQAVAVQPVTVQNS